ncbi:MAG: kdsB [Fibrobacteria bacterium]|jgi:3-deoxy-manno-octulosonate cytidylyltransferase (CMP-KDO synthetase)|nr:kdsB [Fibrobacteria bacterium]
MESGVTCVVPARLGSTRFPGKLLQPLRGKPVVVHALERAAAAGCFDRIFCFTDSPEIAAAVAAHGFDPVLTGEASNGTERIARHLDALPGAGLIVNLQGDEPAFPAEGLRVLCAALRKHPDLVHLLAHQDPPSADDLANPNRVKVAVDALGFVRGFVRAAPDTAMGAGASRSAPTTYRLQLGAYGYSRKYLAGYAALAPSAQEIELSHEILRATDHQPGWAPLRAHFSAPGSSVDVPADLASALQALDNILNAPSPDPQPALQGKFP